MANSEDSRILVLLIWSSLVIILISRVNGQQPGLKLQISQPGIDFASRTAVDSLSGNIVGKKVPDLTGVYNAAVATVSYNVSNILIKSFAKPSATVTVNSGSGITWTITGLELAASGNWRYSATLFLFSVGSGQGTFDFSIGGSSLSLSVTIGRDWNGRPTISVLGCSCNVGTLKTMFQGATWLLNLFTGTIESALKPLIQKAVCEKVNSIINVNGNLQLSTLQTKLSLGADFVLDYQLVDNPLFGSDYIQSFHKGETFYRSFNAEAPFSASPIPTTPTNRMIKVYISDYVINTMGYVLHTNGFLTYVFTINKVPDYRTLLATTCSSKCNSSNTGCVIPVCFGLVFPDASKRYPNSYIELNMTTSTRPTLTITTSSALGNFKGTINAAVRLANSSLIANAVVFDVAILIEVIPDIRGNNITASVKRFTQTTSIISSKVGYPSSQTLNSFLNKIIDSYIVPNLKKVGDPGFAIPTLKDVSYASQSLALINGAVAIEADITYKP